MSLACSSLGAAAVAGIFMIYEGYRDYQRGQVQRECALRERVAHMLLYMASQAG